MAPRMEGIRHDFNRFYAHIIGRQRVESALNAVRFESHIGYEIGYLAKRMHSRIGSTRIAFMRIIVRSRRAFNSCRLG